MVNNLWNASNDGDLNQVHVILKDASLAEIEAKDGAGATPLAQAVKNGHVEIVRALLDAGADFTVISYDVTLEQLTSDATVLDLLSAAREKKTQSEPSQTSYYPSEAYSQEYSSDPSKAYYPHPHGSYMYYPSIHPGAAPMPDSTAPYYAPQPPNTTGQPLQDANGGSNLPPVEIARLIPCRYFPACRYGQSCMFAHPQGPYFQGPLPPPAQYPTQYDPMAQPPYAGYYSVPAPYPPNGVAAPINPMSTPPGSHPSPSVGQNHARNNSEIISPMQTPYNPAPAPMTYGIHVNVPYGQPGQMPLQPVPVNVTTLPPNPSLVSAPQPNGIIYQPTSPVLQTHNSPLIHRRDSSAAQHQGTLSSSVGINENGYSNHGQSVQSQADGYPPMNRSVPRDNFGHGRRGSVRRSSIAGTRKPPCLFFPSGRCRNGDACRFPHVLPDENNQTQTPHFPSKYGARPRYSNGYNNDSLEAKLSGLNLRGDENAHVNGNTRPAEIDGNSRPNGPKPVPLINANGNRLEKRNAARSQRVPNAEDFPVLAGSTTPTNRSPVGQAFNGPTAAQVLQAPPPSRKDSVKSVSQGSRSDGSESGRSEQDEKPMKEANGHLPNGTHEPTSVANSKPASFASIASIASVTPDATNQVSVSA